MNYQEYMVTATQLAANEVFKYAKSVDPEKLDWKPLDAGRSVMDQVRELAKCPDWAYELLSGVELKEPTVEEMEAQKAEMTSWSTVEECQEQCNQKLGKLFELFRSISDERLKETKWLRYDGGRDFTIHEMMDYPRWNFNYHLGQIAYIQVLYGDREMH